MSWSRYCIISLVTLNREEPVYHSGQSEGTGGRAQKWASGSFLHPGVFLLGAWGSRFSFSLFPSTLLFSLLLSLKRFISFHQPCPRIALPSLTKPFQPNPQVLFSPSQLQSWICIHCLHWDYPEGQYEKQPQRMSQHLKKYLWRFCTLRCSVFSWKTATQYMSFRI